jgi:hypothetical protein
VKGREYLDDATKEESGATRASPPSQPRPAQGFLPDSTSSHQHHLQPWNRRHKAHEFQIQRGGKRLRAVERILQIWRPATGAAPRHDQHPPETSPPTRPRSRNASAPTDRRRSRWRLTEQGRRLAVPSPHRGSHRTRPPAPTADQRPAIGEGSPSSHHLRHGEPAAEILYLATARGELRAQIPTAPFSGVAGGLAR